MLKRFLALIIFFYFVSPVFSQFTLIDINALAEKIEEKLSTKQLYSELTLDGAYNFTTSNGNIERAGRFTTYQFKGLKRRDLKKLDRVEIVEKLSNYIYNSGFVQIYADKDLSLITFKEDTEGEESSYLELYIPIKPKARIEIVAVDPVDESQKMAKFFISNELDEALDTFHYSSFDFYTQNGPVKYNSFIQMGYGSNEVEFYQYTGTKEDVLGINEIEVIVAPKRSGFEIFESQEFDYPEEIPEIKVELTTVTDTSIVRDFRPIKIRVISNSEFVFFRRTHDIIFDPEKLDPTEVYMIKKALNQRGYQVNLNSYYDIDLIVGLRDFQIDYGLRICSCVNFDALEALNIVTKNIKF